MGAKRLLIGFYDKSVDKYIDLLNGFEKDGYIVHIFDNLNDETLESISLDYILSDIIEGNFKEKDINIISNNLEFVIKIFKEHSFKYNSFIYDNSILERKYKDEFSKLEKYKYNNNLYFINNDSIKSQDYSKVNNYDLYSLTDNQIVNFIDSAKEAFLSNEIGDYFYAIENKADRIKRVITESEVEEQNRFENIIKKKFYLYCG